jgi:hypothetical protein
MTSRELVKARKAPNERDAGPCTVIFVRLAGGHVRKLCTTK